MDTFSPEQFSQMQQYFYSGATRPYKVRQEHLEVLKRAIKHYEERITKALYDDLHKSPEEAYTTEIGFIYSELNHALKQLSKWMSVEKVRTPLVLFPSKSKIIRDPLGVALIIAPWNYPFQLLMAPLIGSIAGGNCSVLKPSELTPRTSAVITEMIQKNFNKRYITVVEGDGAVVVPKMMNENRFDHVFFTGSIPVGKEIAKMAAPKLVSVTLELGGKSPCIVDRDADIKVAAKRITWGKFTNAGQTCVAPDYLLIHESKKTELLDHFNNSITEFYGTDPKQSKDFGRIINAKRFDVLNRYLTQGNVITGGQTDEEDLYIAPTLLDNVDKNQPVMQEEIFGPILPVLTFKEHEEALALINNNQNPLSLYVFSNNKEIEDLYIDKVRFGGGCINNTLVHLANAELPFGGIGNSGMGSYHGKFSFDTFTRAKPILKTGTWMDPDIKYPPYSGKLKLLKRLFG